MKYSKRSSSTPKNAFLVCFLRLATMAETNYNVALVFGGKKTAKFALNSNMYQEAIFALMAIFTTDLSTQNSKNKMRQNSNTKIRGIADSYVALFFAFFSPILACFDVSKIL